MNLSYYYNRKFSCLNCYRILSKYFRKFSRSLNLQEKYNLLLKGNYELWKNNHYAENSRYLSITYGTNFNDSYSSYLSADLSFLNEYQKKCCYQLYHNRRQKSKRLADRLESMLNDFDCCFLTLTFRDSVLENTSSSTRRQYVRKYLKSICTEFVANIDFGDKDKNSESKEREHYHAVVNVDFVDLKFWNDNFGFIYSERIKKTDLSSKKIAKYVTKLTAHSLKDSTANNRVIYSIRKKEL